MTENQDVTNTENAEQQPLTPKQLRAIAKRKRKAAKRLTDKWVGGWRATEAWIARGPMTHPNRYNYDDPVLVRRRELLQSGMARWLEEGVLISSGAGID